MEIAVFVHLINLATIFIPLTRLMVSLSEARNTMRTSLSKAERELVLKLMSQALQDFGSKTFSELSNDEALMVVTATKLQAKLTKVQVATPSEE